jgi:hypothetical protein
MFVAAFPLALIMSFVSNYIEIRIDAWKLCQQYRRPEPRSAEDIGTWQAILEAISAAAIVCNAGLVAYTGTYAVNETWIVKGYVFMAMASGVLAAKVCLELIIPDIPHEVQIQLERQKYICGKVIDDVGDEDDSELTVGTRAKFDYSVRITDDDPL